MFSAFIVELLYSNKLLTMNIPNPIDSDFFLVVNKGSNIFSILLSSIPIALSINFNIKYSSLSSVDIIILLSVLLVELNASIQLLSKFDNI